MDAEKSALQVPSGQNKIEDDNVAEKLLNIENGQLQKIPYPKRVFLILASVFGERFNFYGMQTILALYLTNKLGYSENDATLMYHANSVLVNFMCIFGGILSDVWLGRFKTICVLSIIYCSASTLISVSSMSLFILSPNTALIIGLLLVSIGGGGMQPCISAFGADQFKIPEQSAYVAAYFSLYYASLNTGAFLSHVIPPILRSEFQCFGQNDCYPLGFGVLTISLFIAMILLLCGKPLYTHVKVSSEDGFGQVLDCITNAIVTKFRGQTKPHKNLLDYSIEKYGVAMVNDTRILLRILLLFLPLPFFYTLYEQQGSRWIFQANRMDGNINIYTIQPDQITTLNSVLVLIFIPLFKFTVYPMISKIGIRRPLQKMATGMAMVAIAFLLSAWVEFKIESAPEKSVKILWLVPQLVALSVGEVMFNVPGYEFSYEIAPDSMKSIVQAFWISTVAFGNIFLLIIVKLSLFKSLAHEFILFAVIMIVAMLIFIYLACNFKPRRTAGNKDIN